MQWHKKDRINLTIHVVFNLPIIGPTKTLKVLLQRFILPKGGRKGDVQDRDVEIVQCFLFLKSCNFIFCNFILCWFVLVLHKTV